jgi:hypothetical protein
MSWIDYNAKIPADICGKFPNIFGELDLKEDKEMRTIRDTHEFRATTFIKKNGLGDTRTADRLPTFGEFRAANQQHQRDVEHVLNEIADLISRIGRQHDSTKTKYDGEFYRDFCVAFTHPDENFTEMPWYQGHIAAERHHINDNCPDDVDLLDILEHIADCVCAGKARNKDGEVYPIKINADILLKAVENTQKLIEDSIKISELDKAEDEPEDIQFT